MNKLTQMETFVLVATKGSLTAAADAEGVVPAVIGRRLDGLESRLGVKLLQRTTRRLTLTQEGVAYLEDCRRILADVDTADTSAAVSGQRARGHLRVTAPAGFGRRHVAPLVPAFAQTHPDVSVSLNLTDRVVDIVNEGYDCAIRVGELPDSSLVSLRLADNRRLCVAAPAYLAAAGRPSHPDDLAGHQCLTLSSNASQARGWAFCVNGVLVHVRPRGRIDCSDGQALHDWCVAGHGIAWRSAWEVQREIELGTLVTVLDAHAAPPTGIFAMYGQRRHLPPRTRLWIDCLRDHFGSGAFESVVGSSADRPTPQGPPHMGDAPTSRQTPIGP